MQEFGGIWYIRCAEINFCCKMKLHLFYFQKFKEIIIGKYKTIGPHQVFIHPVYYLCLKLIPETSKTRSKLIF